MFPTASPAGSRAATPAGPGSSARSGQVVAELAQFCQRRGSGATVALAREWVELERRARAPSRAQLAEWKAALNGWFRQRRAAARVVAGVPPLARTDLGRTPWEQALIAGLRERHRAWRTEQTYRGWMWRFVRWLEHAGRGESTPHPQSLSPVEAEREGRAKLAHSLAEAGAAEVKAFLSHLAVAERVSGSSQKQALNALGFGIG